MGCNVFCVFQQKRKLRIFISNTFNPAKPDAEDGEGTVASWELRVEGRLLEDVRLSPSILLALVGFRFTTYPFTLDHYLVMGTRERCFAIRAEFCRVSCLRHTCS